MSGESASLMQVYVELRAEDPEATSALAVARARLEAGRGLRSLRRVRVFELYGALPDRSQVDDLLAPSGSIGPSEGRSSHCPPERGDGAEGAPISDRLGQVLAGIAGSQPDPYTAFAPRSLTARAVQRPGRWEIGGPGAVSRCAPMGTSGLKDLEEDLQTQQSPSTPDHRRPPNLAAVCGGLGIYANTNCPERGASRTAGVGPG